MAPIDVVAGVFASLAGVDDTVPLWTLALAFASILLLHRIFVLPSDKVYANGKAGVKELASEGMAAVDEAAAHAQGASETSPSQAGVFDSMPSHPHLQGVFVPGTGTILDGGLVHSNASDAYPFENDHAWGSLLPLHRPTYDPKLDASGEYPYGGHFSGRKRLWEIRVQLKFKRTPTEALRFGIELEDYVPLNAASKGLMRSTVGVLRRAVGNDLYHSPGDDPAVRTGPCEKPTFVMPLWAFDQFEVTPEGKEPPTLWDPNFYKIGHLRANDRAAFIRKMAALKLEAGPTYTFAFWGISQFLDDIKWQLTKVIPFTKIDFDKFCGRPPVHLVMYSLRSDGDGDDGRHLQHKKNYYLHLAFWSSERKPAESVLRRLLPHAYAAARSDASGKDGSKSRSCVRHCSAVSNFVERALQCICATGRVKPVPCSANGVQSRSGQRQGK